MYLKTAFKINEYIIFYKKQFWRGSKVLGRTLKVKFEMSEWSAEKEPDLVFFQGNNNLKAWNARFTLLNSYQDT